MALKTSSVEMKESQVSRQNSDSSVLQDSGTDPSKRIGALQTSLGALNVITVLVFSFAARLSALYTDAEAFNNPETIWIFQIINTLSMGCALHCLTEYAIIVYKANKHVIDGASGTPKIHYPHSALYLFYLMIMLFITGLCVLFFDAMDWRLAMINTIILGLAIIGSLAIAWQKI